MAIRFAPTLSLIVQFCTFHTGVITDVKDEDGVMCVKCDCNGLVGEGGSVGWICLSTTPIGSSKGDGDEGLWWPVQKGHTVRIGFLAGDPFILYAFLGPAVSDGEGNPLIPAEAVALWKQDKRKPTRIRLLKGESGHTLLMDDNGKQELLALLNWTGSGLAIYGPGKEEGDDDPRSGEKRGKKNVFDGSAKKPTEIVEGEIEYLGLLDLWKQGLVSFGTDKTGGVVQIAARKKDGSLGPSLTLDAIEDRAYLTTSEEGETQLQLLGKAKAIYVTKQMIWEAPFQKVKGVFSGVLKELAKAFAHYS